MRKDYLYLDDIQMIKKICCLCKKFKTSSKTWAKNKKQKSD